MHQLLLRVLSEPLRMFLIGGDHNAVTLSENPGILPDGKFKLPFKDIGNLSWGCLCEGIMASASNSKNVIMVLSPDTAFMVIPSRSCFAGRFASLKKLIKPPFFWW